MCVSGTIPPKLSLLEDLCSHAGRGVLGYYLTKEDKHCRSSRQWLYHLKCSFSPLIASKHNYRRVEYELESFQQAASEVGEISE